MQGNDSESVVRKIRDEYTRIAERRTSGCALPCSGEGAPGSERYGYDTGEIGELPKDADMGLGCGAPIPALDLQPGETVLDLGSGGGIDVFLASSRVGPTGHVIGVDMTPTMLELARENARKGGYANVEFREGRLESLPVDDASVDAVTSNCVINLVPDKRAVFAEVARVLRPGGRFVISDIVIRGELPEALRRELTLGDCILTAIAHEAYMESVRASGFDEVTILRDVAYLEAAGWHTIDDVNEESRALLTRAGVDFEQTKRQIRSITLRAIKPARNLAAPAFEPPGTGRDVL
jgi:arsenite methyltransferase